MAEVCTRPPPGWRCTRAREHEGPCAAVAEIDWDRYHLRPPSECRCREILDADPARHFNGCPLRKKLPHSPAIEKLIAAARALEKDWQSPDEREEQNAIRAVLEALAAVDAEAKDNPFAERLCVCGHMRSKHRDKLDRPSSTDECEEPGCKCLEFEPAEKAVG